MSEKCNSPCSPESAIESLQIVDGTVTFQPVHTSYRHMQSFVSIRLAAAISFAFCASLPAQSPPGLQAKPGLATTSAPNLPALPPAPPPTPSQLPPRPAHVAYTSGTLSVAADNSSLNQILREISRTTGIKITGGVTDERVFGQYGPDATAKVLAALLDGTGSNMLLVQSDGDTPQQLILTARQGGPTPPNPNAAISNDANDPRGTPPGQPVLAPPAESNDRVPPPDPPVPSATGAQPASDATQPESPNGVKTPQQIYDQLQRLRQPQPPPQ
jgi:hypothetical protein